MNEERTPEVQPSADLEQAAVRLPRDGWKAALFSLVLLAAVLLETGRMSMGLLALALVLALGRRPLALMGSRVCLATAGFLAFSLVTLAAAVRSSVGSVAVEEFYKYLAAFALALALLARLEKRHVPALLWGFAAVSAAISLLCIDEACAQVLFVPFKDLIYSLGGTYEWLKQPLGTRITGIYNDANVSASILGLGCLVSLHLASEKGALWKKLSACVLLGISALGFFLSLSRGAILFFGLSLLVYLAAAGKGRRLPLFFLMVVSAVVTVACSVAAMPGLSNDTLAPDLLAPLCGLGIFLLDWAVGARLARVLEGKGKWITVAVGVFLAACLVYAAAAVQITGAYTFDNSGLLFRTVSLEPGDYTVSGDWDGDIQLKVTFKQTDEDQYSESTQLYKGPMEEAAFTMESAGTVILQFNASQGQVMREVAFSDGTEVPLGYPLLPAFVANRLQDSLASSSSTSMRLRYFRDTWTIFTLSPILGHGLGSTEVLFTAVQPFYYASKYAHNHILQVMADMGLVGLAAFGCLLLGSLLLILRGLGRKDPMAAVLLACWVMINTHSLMEINFSMGAYLCIAMVLLLLPAVLYSQPLPAKDPKASKAAGAVALCLLWLALAASFGVMEGNRMAVRRLATQPTDSVEAYLASCEEIIALDKLDPEQMKLNYLANAVRQEDNSPYYDKMVRYVQDLREAGTYFSCTGISRYYYLYLGQLDQVFETSREAIAQKASESNAWNLQFQFYRQQVLPALAEEDTQAFLDGVLGTRDYMEAYNQTHIGQIALSKQDGAFLTAVEEIAAAGLPAGEAYAQLTALLTE